MTDTHPARAIRKAGIMKRNLPMVFLLVLTIFSVLVIMGAPPLAASAIAWFSVIVAVLAGKSS